MGTAVGGDACGAGEQRGVVVEHVEELAVDVARVLAVGYNGAEGSLRGDACGVFAAGADGAGVIAVEDLACGGQGAGNAGGVVAVSGNGSQVDDVLQQTV